MSGSGMATLAVLVLGGSYFWHSVAVAPRETVGPGSEDGIAAVNSLRLLHHQVAQRLRAEGDVEAAEWHERAAGEWAAPGLDEAP